MKFEVLVVNGALLIYVVFAIASLIEGTSAVERAYVIKAGSDRSGNA